MNDSTDPTAAEHAAETDEGATDGAPKRQRGAISFPYFDLDEATKVALGAWKLGGTGTTPLDALAVEIGHSTISSGGFRGKLGAARLFGLCRTSGMDVTLTALGTQLADPDRADEARVEAFLRVPLFATLYERHRGSPLPGDSAIENEMAELGVAPKQKGRARQVFQRSAEQAGFFRAARDKLIRPTNAGGINAQEAAEQEQPPPPLEDGTADEGMPKNAVTEPLIRGLFEKLPAPGVWPEADRDQWLQAAKVIFSLVYKPEPTSPKALPSESEPPAAQSQNGAQGSTQPDEQVLP